MPESDLLDFASKFREISDHISFKYELIETHRTRWWNWQETAGPNDEWNESEPSPGRTKSFYGVETPVMIEKWEFDILALREQRRTLPFKVPEDLSLSSLSSRRTVLTQFQSEIEHNKYWVRFCQGLLDESQAKAESDKAQGLCPDYRWVAELRDKVFEYQDMLFILTASQEKFLDANPAPEKKPQKPILKLLWQPIKRLLRKLCA